MAASAVSGAKRLEDCLQLAQCRMAFGVPCHVILLALTLTGILLKLLCVNRFSLAPLFRSFLI